MEFFFLSYYQLNNLDLELYNSNSKIFHLNVCFYFVRNKRNQSINHKQLFLINHNIPILKLQIHNCTFYLINNNIIMYNS